MWHYYRDKKINVEILDTGTIKLFVYSKDGNVHCLHLSADEINDLHIKSQFNKRFK